MPNTTTITTADVPITLTTQGSGRPVLLLHGGGGPLTVAAYAEHLAAGARVLTPTHPGFGGTPRPPELTTIRGLAELYTALLADLDLSGVAVVGNSIGGWIAAEMALLDTGRVSHVVLVDAVGIEVPGHPVADFFSLTFPELARLSYFAPEGFEIDPSTMPPAALAVMAGNREALATYAGQAMSDPTLAARLAEVTTPALVVFGEADRIADPDYGRAYAAAIPGARFALLPETGHLPQLESPERLTSALLDFLTTPADA